MSTQVPSYSGESIPSSARFAIVAARFNAKVVDELLAGCCQRLGQLGVGEERIELFRVPGAFELPLAAKLAARTGRFAAVIALGAVIRGGTPHFEYVAGECARGISQVSLEAGLPVIFGVLTVNDEKQAWERLGGSHGHNGVNAAEAAVEMVALGVKIAAGA